MTTRPPSGPTLKRFYVSMVKAHEARNEELGYDLLALAKMTPNEFDNALSAVWERDWGASWRTIEVLEIAGHKSQFRARALAMLTTLTESGPGEVGHLARAAISRLRAEPAR